MRSNVIIALNSETNGTIHQLLRRSVERARRHVLLSIWALRHRKIAKLTGSFAQSQPRCVGLPIAQYPARGIGNGAFWAGIVRKRRTGSARIAACGESLEKEAGKALRIVADDAVLFEQVVQNDAQSKLLQFDVIHDRGLSSFSAVAPGHLGRNGMTICHDPIQHTARCVLLDGAHVIRNGVAGCLARLSHEVRDVDTGGSRRSRSEEHTSELQSLAYLVCRLL